MKYFRDEYLPLKGERGLSEDSYKVMVEATEGCDINQGKCARRVKSTKIVHKFCRLASLYSRFQNWRKILENIDDQAIRKNKKFRNLPQNFHTKRQGGEG
jgi:hypothetical protein